MRLTISLPKLMITVLAVATALAAFLTQCSLIG